MTEAIDILYVCIQIESRDQEEKKQMKLFPDDDRNGRILCHALTNDFLYYGTDVRFEPLPFC